MTGAGSNGDGGVAELIDQLRVLADPVPLQLLWVLRAAQEPMTQAALGRRLPAARSNMRYHLVRLQRARFIEEATVAGKKGWQAAPLRKVDYAGGDSAAEPRVVLAQAALERNVTQRRAELIMSWADERLSGRWSEEWSQHSIGMDGFVHMRPDEVAALEQDFYSLLRTHKAAAEDRREREGDDGAEAVFVTLHAFPFSAGR